MIKNGLLCEFGNLTEPTQKIFNHHAFTCSASTITRIKPSIIRAIRNRLENYLINPPGSQYILLIILDNFNPHYILTPSSTSTFCNSILTVNILYRWICADTIISVRSLVFLDSKKRSITVLNVVKKKKSTKTKNHNH